MGFMIGLVVGTLVTGVVFIVFGKNNKKKIEAARSHILGLYAKAEGEVKEVLGQVETLLKK